MNVRVGGRALPKPREIVDVTGTSESLTVQYPLTSHPHIVPLREVMKCKTISRQLTRLTFKSGTVIHGDTVIS